MLSNFGVDFGAIDAVRVAEACGADGIRVSNLADLTSAVEKAAHSRSSTVIEIPMDPDLYAAWSDEARSRLSAWDVFI